MAARLPDRLTRLPAALAAALIAESQLRAAERAAARLRENRDPEALHDFRVGVRRLATHLKAYAPVLGRAARARRVQKLKRLLTLTNGLRDAEAGLAWLERRERALGGRDLAETRRLERKLRRALEDDAPRLERRALKRFRRQAGRLHRGLEAAIHEALPAGRRRAPFSAEAARVTRTCARELERRLARIRSLSDVEAQHRARIAAKRVRYLLEEIPDGARRARTAARAKALQGLLGDIHDRSLLLDARLPPGPARLAERERAELYGRLVTNLLRARRGRSARSPATLAA